MSAASNQTDAMTAHAEARLLGSATKVMAITLERARLTNRLKEGDSMLPVTLIQGSGNPIQSAIDVSAEQPQIAANVPS